jgi:hypothetical protein
MIRNSALLEDERLLLMASTDEMFQELLDVYTQRNSSIAAQPEFQSLVANLDNPTAALLVGNSMCEDLSLTAWIQELLDRGIPQTVIDEFPSETLSSVHAYRSLGVGYQLEQNVPMGRIILHYTNPEEAQADLESRKILAQNGISFGSGMTYRESLFSLEDIYVQDGDLLLDVRPYEDKPGRLYQMVYQQDMTFAVCP